MNDAIDYVRQSVDMDEVKSTISQMEKSREPLYRTNRKLCDQIYDLMEEYSRERDFPEGWWMNYDDEESIFFKL